MKIEINQIERLYKIVFDSTVTAVYNSPTLRPLNKFPKYKMF